MLLTRDVAPTSLASLTGPIFMVPYVRDDKFVGREDILDQIEEHLQRNRRVSLTGLGGVGYEFQSHKQSSLSI